MTPAFTLAETWSLSGGTVINAIMDLIKTTGERDIGVIEHPDVIEEEGEDSTVDVITVYMANLMEGLAKAEVVVPNISKVIDYLLQYQGLTDFVLLAAQKSPSPIRFGNKIIPGSLSRP
ncbi:hypothetical protein GF359_02665 [candidate division WOR-3 bacterium]|uniref:Uncharacterized protein n=1 Tax=candidate division WOR-3 bacterium TaxID=2052148 RepID=A0A9D5K897_UNCW3|nr:hypothetical protein [candidate division WOR-3 bacterium]MBD3364097.1 hypothetical protein [candidate division WOR-3 bacterium]